MVHQVELFLETASTKNFITTSAFQDHEGAVMQWLKQISSIMVVVEGAMVDSTLFAKMLFNGTNLENEQELHKSLHLFYYKIEEINEKLKSVSNISLLFFHSPIMIMS